MKRQREQVRLNNLEILIAEAGSATKVAELAGTSESYLSQVRRKMLTQSGTPRGLGNELAAKLEKGLGKPTGWMDEPHEVVYKASDTHRRVRVVIASYTRGTISSHQSVRPDAAHQKQEPSSTVVKTRFSQINAERSGYHHPLPVNLMGTGLRNIRSATRLWNNGCTGDPALPVPCSQGTFILRVKGASMEPKFYNGDLIFVDPAIVVESGKYVVVNLKTPMKPCSNN